MPFGSLLCLLGKFLFFHTGKLLICFESDCSVLVIELFYMDCSSFHSSCKEKKNTLLFVYIYIFLHQLHFFFAIKTAWRYSVLKCYYLLEAVNYTDTLALREVDIV